jgi:tetratricopeptide (TPR) repeat protein
MPSDQSNASSEIVITPAERYERAMALKNAGQHKSAIEQFEKAATDPVYALKAFAQMGLCLKVVNRYEEAVVAFRKALATASASPQETVQILYVLGRTLQSLGRVAESLEAYRWIRREEPEYRDVASRIESLSSRRPAAAAKKEKSEESPIATAAVKSLQNLLANGR